MDDEITPMHFFILGSLENLLDCAELVPARRQLVRFVVLVVKGLLGSLGEGLCGSDVVDGFLRGVFSLEGGR